MVLIESNCCCPVGRAVVRVRRLKRQMVKSDRLMTTSILALPWVEERIFILKGCRLTDIYHTLWPGRRSRMGQP